MKIFDKIHSYLKKDDSEKKMEKNLKNAENNLTEENRNALRYLFASFFGIAALMAFSATFYKLFFVYLFLGISILPIIYHNPLTKDFDPRKIRAFEILIPFIILIFVLLL